MKYQDEDGNEIPEPTDPTISIGDMTAPSMMALLCEDDVPPERREILWQGICNLIGEEAANIGMVHFKEEWDKLVGSMWRAIDG